MRRTDHTLAALELAGADALGGRSRVRELGAGVSALLVFAMLLGLTVSAMKPAVAERARDGSGERLSTRAITWHATRVAQRITHRQEHKPIAALALVSRTGLGCVETLAACPVGPPLAVAGGVRVGLLDLPPPLA